MALEAFHWGWGLWLRLLLLNLRHWGFRSAFAIDRGVVCYHLLLRSISLLGPDVGLMIPMLQILLQTLDGSLIGISAPAVADRGTRVGRHLGALTMVMTNTVDEILGETDDGGSVDGAFSDDVASGNNFEIDYYRLIHHIYKTI
jgi:hypothetical protein